MYKDSKVFGQSDRLTSIPSLQSSRKTEATEQAVAAVNQAAAAFPSWSSTTPEKRKSILLAIAENLESHRENIKKVASEEVGSKNDWLDINMDKAVALLHSAADVTTQIVDEIIPCDIPGKRSMTVRQPVGVCLGIASWNAPILLAVRAIAIPLACGNTVILKASELCPETHILIGKIFSEAGLPDNVLKVVTNLPDEAESVVEALIAHPAVRRINFTGSTRVGHVIARLAARFLKPCLLGLSGKSPFIVLDDANIESAVEAAIYGSFLNQGQLCMATERVILQDAIADQFISLFVAKAKLLKSGTTGDPNHKLGPLINIESGKRLQAIIDDAVSKGANVLCGGQVNGLQLDATVIDNVTHSMRVYFEESFGPLAQIIRCSTDKDAITIANDTEFGLSASVFSKDTNRALTMARQIESGICHINSPTTADQVDAPFGGMKASGYGRFGSKTAINEFTELRWITVSDDGSDILAI